MRITHVSAATRACLLIGIAVVLTACLAAGCSAPVPANAPYGYSARDIPRDELRMASDPGAVLEAARALMEVDAVVALATVDETGQPRVRSVRAFLDPVEPGRPASGFTVWVLTRLTTRKVDQVRAQPQVTLYFNEDEKGSYATIMGTAVVHTDPSHPGAMRHYEREDVKFFWPDFPRDFVMLEIRPRWLEFIGPGAADDDYTWRPQAVVFE